MKTLEEYAEEQSRDEEAIKAGLQSEFWRVLRGYLCSLREEAVGQLTVCDPMNMGRMAEYQKTAQICGALISHVESYQGIED